MLQRNLTLNLWWARAKHFLIFPQSPIIFSHLSSNSLIFFFNFVLWMGDSPIWEGPGYATAVLQNHTYIDKVKFEYRFLIPGYILDFVEVFILF